MTTGPALARGISRLEAYATLVGVVVGAGVFVLVGEIGAATGGSAPLAFLALLPVLLTTALAYAVYISTPLGTRPGGAYLHISETLGLPVLGYMVMWLKLVAYLGATAVIALGFANYAIALFADPNAQTPGWVTNTAASGLVLVLYVIHVRGISAYGRLQLYMVVALLAAILVLVVPGLMSVSASHFDPLFPNGSDGFIRVLPEVLFAYLGFEALAQLAGETRDPAKTLPRVFIFGILAAALIYTAMAFVTVGVLSMPELASTGTPVSDAASKYLPAAGALVVSVGAILACASSVNANLVAPSRLLMVFAQDGLTPRYIAAVNPTTHTPVRALTVTVVAILLLIWTGTMGYSLQIAIQAMILLYACHSLTFAILPFANRPLFDAASFKVPPVWVAVTGVFSAASLAWMTYEKFSASDVWVLLGIWSGVGAALCLGTRLSEGRRAAVPKEEPR